MDGVLFVNDTRSTPRSEYLQAFSAEYPVVVEFFPELAGLRIVPIFSSPGMPEDAVAFLTGHGVFALVFSGRTMELVNSGAISGEG